MKKPGRDEIIGKVREAGVVGAGGAGFPTHGKIDATVETLIVNIAECEPLIWKDKEIARHFPHRIVQGAELVMQVTGARRALFALKEQLTGIADILKDHLKPRMSLAPLEDYYPAGDEVALTCDVTGKVIPEGALPLSEGVLVLNAETLYHIAQAIDGEPVTEKFLTVSGTIDRPVTVRAPVGMTLEDLFDALNMTGDNLVPFLDGVMMGTMVTDLATPIAKTTSGIVLLPEDHCVVLRRKRSVDQDRRIIRSACDQCSYCTEYCPRYLLGHRVEPHRIMRSLSFTGTHAGFPDYAAGCVACGLCTLFACPESLSPDSIMKKVREQMKGEHRAQSRSVHPMREFRKVPAKKLMRRLSLLALDRPAPLSPSVMQTRRVIMMLTTYGGTPLQPLKKVGEYVSRGERIASPQERALGASLHASIQGRITRIENESLSIERTE